MAQFTHDTRLQRVLPTMDRIPAGLRVDRTFLMLLAMVGAMSAAPLFIAWVASGLLQ